MLTYEESSYFNHWALKLAETVSICYRQL